MQRHHSSGSLLVHRVSSLSFALALALAGCAVPIGPAGGGSESNDAASSSSSASGQAAASDEKTVEAFPFEALIPQHFRFGSKDYQMTEATAYVVRRGTELLGTAVTIDLDIQNRLDAESKSQLEWDLVLADGTRVNIEGPSLHLLPLQKAHIQLEFPIEDRIVSLVGASLEPHGDTVTSYRRVAVPLDAPFAGEPGIELVDVAGVHFTTPTNISGQWEITIDRARVVSNSDYAGGQRAPYRMKLVEVQARWRLSDDGIANLFDDMMGVNVNAYLYDVQAPNISLMPDAGHTVILQYVVPVPEDAQDVYLEFKPEDDWINIPSKVADGVAVPDTPIVVP